MFHLYSQFFLGEGNDGNFHSYTFTNLHSVRNVDQSKSETNSLLTGRISKRARFQTDKKWINNEIRNHYGRRCRRFNCRPFFVILTIGYYGVYRVTDGDVDFFFATNNTDLFLVKSLFTRCVRFSVYQTCRSDFPIRFEQSNHVDIRPQFDRETMYSCPYCRP